MAKAVDITDFSFGYHDVPNALVDINLTIDHGDKVALIGPNGAGKSSLLLAMSVFVKGSGRILIDGIEVAPASAKKVRRRLASVLQNPDEQLFMPTLFDDVSFGPMNMKLPREQVIERTETALKRVGLLELKDRPGHHLSAGQKRAAAIATVLSMAPKIITMDEPDTSLDPKSRNTIIEILNSLEQTLIVATCSMDFAASLCSRAVVINRGKIIADGPSEKIMSDKKLMEDNFLEVPWQFR